MPGHHSFVSARPKTPPTTPAPTGIDYTRLVAATHQAELAHRVNYAALAQRPLPEGGGELPGPLDPLTGDHPTPATSTAPTTIDSAEATS
ncbi:MAG: hypothetical protein ACRDSP_26500 [Pseudonocardiaceae bacterium]